jgi:hypothetical protein
LLGVKTPNALEHIRHPQLPADIAGATLKPMAKPADLWKSEDAAKSKPKSALLFRNYVDAN